MRKRGQTISFTSQPTQVSTLKPLGSKLAHGLRSLWGRLTEGGQHKFGILTMTDGKQRVFVNPKSSKLDQRDDGVYRVIEHDAGNFEVEAAKVFSWEIMTQGRVSYEPRPAEIVEQGYY